MTDHPRNAIRPVERYTATLGFVMYILLRERGERGEQFSIHDLRAGKDVRCEADFSKLSCKDLVIRGDELFAYNLETRTVVVYDLGSGVRTKEIPLQDVLGLTLTESKIYIWNIDNEVFAVEHQSQEFGLKKMATSRKDINYMKVIRNTDERFTFAMETFNSEVCVLMKTQDVTKITVVKSSQHRLIGATEKHLFLFAEDSGDVVEYHNGTLTTIFNADADSDFCWRRARVCCGKMYAFYTEFQMCSPTAFDDSSDESRSDDDNEPQALWKLEIIETESGDRRIYHLGFAFDIWHICAVDTC